MDDPTVTTAATAAKKENRRAAQNLARRRDQYKTNRKDPVWLARQAELLEKKRAAGNKKRAGIWSQRYIHDLLSLETDEY
jgi:hypothetical protein